MEEKGIVIIGAGHWIYGQMASNLAVSIRRYDSQIPIVIYTTPGTIKTGLATNLSGKARVDIRLLPAETYLIGDKPNYLRPKVHLYDLSPFSRTLFLDADTLWLPGTSPSKIFDQLSETDFAMSNEGYIETQTGVKSTTGFYTLWAAWDDIRAKYGPRMKDKIYQLRSEFLYFTREKSVKRFFSMAKKIYDAPGIYTEKSGGVVPDEFAFNIASSTLGLYPHKSNWTPAFWWFREWKGFKKQYETVDIVAKWPILSMGGNASSEKLMKWYNAMCVNHYKRLGLFGQRDLANKREYLPERKDK